MYVDCQQRSSDFCLHLAEKRVLSVRGQKTKKKHKIATKNVLCQLAKDWFIFAKKSGVSILGDIASQYS